MATQLLSLSSGRCVAIGMGLEKVSEIIFSALVLIISAGVTAHILHGYGSNKWKESFLAIILAIACLTQMYFIIDAASYVPMKPYSSSVRPDFQLDCLTSSKGGKRSQNSFMEYDFNPCYCHVGAQCIDRLTGIIISSNGTCPQSLDYDCVNPISNEKIPLYLPDERNCDGGKGPVCSYREPCDPCDRDELAAWRSGRCQTCSAHNKGHCNFIPGVGPYCRERRGSKKVVPCEKCCTRGEVLMIDGICY